MGCGGSAPRPAVLGAPGRDRGSGEGTGGGFSALGQEGSAGDGGEGRKDGEVAAPRGPGSLPSAEAALSCGKEGALPTV